MKLANRTSVVRAVLSVLVVGLMWVGYAAPKASAQVLYGSVAGTVTDQSGAVVPEATVTITNVETGQTREVKADAAGYYSIRNVLEGTYDLSVKKEGFRAYMEKGVRVSINSATNVNARMQVGGVTESITVEASAAVLQTTKADVSTSLESRAVENLPLSNYRNFQTLINLVPGATPGRFQNAEADTPERALTTNVNGQQAGANNTRLDGSADILVTLPHHAVYIPPVESIQEVNVSTNNFDAEQGMTGGAAVTVVTKSGTNDFHGSIFGFHNNKATRAFTWDENRAGVTRKPKTIQNIDGGSIGGPIKKDKLFFFADWEGLFERANRSRLQSVPLKSYFNGDLSSFLGNQILDAAGSPIMVPTTEGGSVPLQEGMIFDPYSGNLDGTGRSVMSSNGVINAIPANRLNGPMMQLFNLLPDPNQEGDFDNYYVSGTQRLNRNNVDAKINWNRNDKHQLWFKYSTMVARFNSAGFSLGAAGGEDIGDGGLGGCHTRTQIAGIGQTYTLTPTFLIDATLGWTRFGQACQPPDQISGVNFGSDVLGIPGTNGPDPREAGMPSFYVGSYSVMGNPEGWNPAFRNDQSYTFNANASWMKGTHEIRFGFDYLHHLMNHFQPELGAGPRGSFNFGSGIMALNPSALEESVGFEGGNTPDFETDQAALAAAMMGIPDSSGKSSQYIKMDSLEGQYATYIRDRWRATPKLTVDLGLRWELYPNRRRSAGLGIESYDPTTNMALIGGRGGVPRDNGVKWSKKLLAPRVGLAYQVTPTTVIRSGYGITYHSHPWGAQALRGWFPLTVVAWFNGVNGYQPVTTDPTYVADGVPNAPLGTDVGIPSIFGFNINQEGGVPLPNAAEDGFPAANQLLRRGYIQSWNFIVEHKFPGEMVASIGYVGTRSVRDFAFRDINTGQIPGAGLDGQLLYTRFGRTAATRQYDGMLGSTYHSLQVSLNRRMTAGLLLKGAYTYSHAIDMTSYSDWTETTWPSNLGWGRNRASATYNIPHNLQFAYVYELPFGADKRFARTGASRKILGGWQLNGIFSSFMGRQFTLSASDSSLDMPGNAQTPDQVGPIKYTGCVGSGAGCRFFDTSSFVPVTAVRFGTVGRNTMRGPGVVNTDLSLYRTFKLSEKFDLQFRAEGFNLWNTPHFSNPNGNANSSRFGQVTATYSTWAYGRSREFRFGLRLGF